MSLKNHTGYPTNSVTLHTEKIIDWRAFDAKEPTNTNSNRLNYGNNRYSISNIDQFLNSFASAGSWYSTQHSYDAPPNTSNVLYSAPYEARNGFLYHFTEREREIILETSLSRLKHSVDTAGIEAISRKVFLPARVELGLGNLSTSEGSAWSYYTTNALRIKSYTTQVYDNSTYTNKDNASHNQIYWTSSIAATTSSYSERVAYVTQAGAIGTTAAYTRAYNSYGIAPALNIDGNTKVTTISDTDGYYYFILNRIPTKPDNIYLPDQIKAGENFYYILG